MQMQPTLSLARLRDPEVVADRLDAFEVHVWCVALDAGDWILPDVLSCDEWKRAAGFRSAAQRREFITSRLALRTLLASYVGERADSIQFYHADHAKPGPAR